MSAVAAYEALVERGCLCGTDRIAECPLHTRPKDYRGLRAFFKAGMPHAFPSTATCSLCGSEGLMYPNVEIDDPTRSGKHLPTLVCPNCSTPATEMVLQMDAQLFGHKLNTLRVFSAESRAADYARLVADQPEDAAA